MKKWLCLLACSLLFAASANAGVLLYEAFNYPNGNIVTNSGGVWTNHSGDAGDSLVRDGKYEINQNRRDDVSRAFDTPNMDQFLFASFTVNMQSLPSASGTYFAHFKDDTSSNFLARVFALTTGTVVPGTYRLGVANASGNTTNIFPMDLATNVDYRVVVSYDSLSYISTLQVNPASASDTAVVNSSVVSGAAANAVLSTYGFRQSAGEGVMTVDDLLVGNTFEDVMTNSPSGPALAIQPVGGTIYEGSSFDLFSLGHGTGNLSYQWRLNGTPVSDGGAISGAQSNVLRITSATAAQSGSWDVVVTGQNSSVTSQAAVLTVNPVPQTPLILRQPWGATNGAGSVVTLSVQAVGVAPLSYQWTWFGTNLPGAISNRLTLSAVSPANSGPYTVVVSNPNGIKESDVVYVSVLPPLRTNIAYLRTLVDPVTYLPTNTSALFETEGVVTTHTNITTAANAQFYISDGTGGITVFVRNSSTFRPQAGDRVRVLGPLEHFNSLLEIAPNANNPMHQFEILSSNNPMPNARAFHFSQTNNLQTMEREFEGSLVTVTNVYFTSANGTAAFSANGNYTVSNAQGQTFTLRLDGRVTSLNGRVIPAFAHQVTGVMGQFLDASATPRNTGYQLMITRPEDIVTTLPPAPSLEVKQEGGKVHIMWATMPGSTYTLHSTDDLRQAFKPLSNGFNALGGQVVHYAETNTTAQARFFRVTSP